MRVHRSGPGLPTGGGAAVTMENVAISPNDTRTRGQKDVNYWLDQCHFGDCLETLRQMPDGLVQTCVTSPPYFGLRDYSGGAAEIGKEKTPDEFVAALVAVFREVRRVLRDDGTLWLNIGDSYAGSNMTGGNNGINASGGSDGFKIKRQFDRKNTTPDCKPKDLIGIPWLLAFALRADGWYLRQEIIWHKPNPMPESVTDRCTKSHESIFLLAKSEKYYFDNAAIKEPGKNPADDIRRMLAQKQANKSMPDDKVNGLRPKVSKADSFKRDGSKRAEVIPGQTVGTHRPDRDEATPDGMSNKRSVWTVATTPYAGAHFATFPPALIEPCILAGAPAGGVVLDPFYGSGTTGQVAQALGRHYIGCELNPAYKPLQDERTAQPSLLLAA